MFRRRREASFRPPASAAWWPVSATGGADPAGYDGYGDYGDGEYGDGEYGDQAPALPGGDPFGGWPAFPAADPVDPVLGRPEPFAGWTPPGSPGQPPHPGGHPSHAGGHPSFPGGHPSFPGAHPPPPPVQPRPADRAPAEPPAPPAPSRSAAPPAGPARSWTPLLTHADDGQPFQTDREATDEPDLDDPISDAEPINAADRPGGHPETRRVRAARRRATARATEARTAPATTAPAPPAAGPAPAPAPAAPVAGSRPAPVAAPAAASTPVTRPAPVPEQLGESAFSRGATTWLDPVAPPDPMEAASLAGAFAADYLSWDEAAQRRRGEVLAQYLPSDVVGSADLLGWSGKGRQRAEFSLPGAVRPDGDGRVVVDVRVRVTPYAKVGVPAEPAPAEELEVAGVPAVAPAPTARGWKSMDSYWVRLTVPVVYDRGRLVVDVWEEQLGNDPDPDPDDGLDGGLDGDNGFDGVAEDQDPGIEDDPLDDGVDAASVGDRRGDATSPDGGTRREAPRAGRRARDASS